MKTLCNAVRQKHDQGQRAPQNYTDSTVVDTESTSHELEVDQPGPIIVVCPQPKAAVPAKQLYFYHKPQPKKNQDMPKIGFV